MTMLALRVINHIDHCIVALKNLKSSKVAIKANTDKLYNELDIYMNELVDDKVNSEYDSDYISKYNATEESVFFNIFTLNNQETIQSFQKILNSPLTNNDAATRKLVRNAADNTSKLIAEKETERVLKNLEHVERTLNQSKVNIEIYRGLTDNLNPTVSRYEILKISLDEGKMYSGRDLTYRQLSNLAKNLEKYKISRVDYDEAITINEKAINEGLPPVYTHKVWIWSKLENTRHRNMDGEKVELEDYFEVHNEVNGDVDHLLFPGDVENYRNPSNQINCKCKYEIMPNDGSVTIEDYLGVRERVGTTDDGIKRMFPFNRETSEEDKINKDLPKEVKDLLKDEKYKKIIEEHLKKFPNEKYEKLSVIQNDGKFLFELKTSEKPDEVVFTLAEKRMFIDKNTLAIIHNHPDNIPLPSIGDLNTQITTGTKYSFIKTDNGIGVIVNSNPEANKIFYAIRTDLVNKKIDKLYKEYVINNQDKYIEVFNENLNPVGIELKIFK